MTSILANEGRFLFSIAVAVLLLSCCVADCPAAEATHENKAADSSIGTVRDLKGKVFLLHEGKEAACKIGDQIAEHDTLRTEAKSSLGVVLRDETVVSMGPNSEFAAKDFVFKPDKGVSSLVLAMVRGTFVYMSGKIAKLAPDAVHIETPIGAITVRGTKLLINIAAPSAMESTAPNANKKYP